MTTCPRCHQPVESEAIKCPFCQNQLKAYGHPGITLHQSTGETFLCADCRYHQDDTCNFPKRPYAKSCTLYQDYANTIANQSVQPLQSNFNLSNLKYWLQRNRGLILLLCIVLISVLLTFT